jgi:hypothetical protein
LYRGINAHLHSVLQNQYAGWEEFHGTHTTHIAEFIDRILPPRYLAKPQRSFQITAIAADELESQTLRIARPDATIYEQRAWTSSTVSAADAASPSLTLTLAEIYDNPEDYLSAVAIVPLEDSTGQPVVWIELLSPSNKPPALAYADYHQKRGLALAAGIVMVEIDYLHQSRTILTKLARYPKEGSYPYYIAVTTPRPTFTEGLVHIYGFVVDQSIPKVPIPLLGKDSITVDFGAIYNHTFESLRSFSEYVDYEAEPPRFNTYHEEDQKRIREKMADALQSLRQEN